MAKKPCDLHIIDSEATYIMGIGGTVDSIVEHGLKHYKRFAVYSPEGELVYCHLDLRTPEPGGKINIDISVDRD